MKDKRSMHLKVQELCDCFADTDPLVEMTTVQKSPDVDESALKWIALAILHGIDSYASKISISRDLAGHVTVTAKYRKDNLPSPGDRVGEQIIRAFRDITHIEQPKGSTQLALGIRDSSLDLSVKLEEDKEGERVTISFPE